MVCFWRFESVRFVRWGDVIMDVDGLVVTSPNG